MLKIGSLFSGYGGLDIAVAKQFDAQVVWHCEWEDAPSKILEANFPGVPNYRDVTQGGLGSRGAGRHSYWRVPLPGCFFGGA